MKPATTPGIRAGCRVDGTTLAPTISGTPLGVKSVVRTVGGDGAGDYTVTLFPDFTVDPNAVVPMVNVETHLAAHPFTSDNTVDTTAHVTTVRVRTISNGAAADCVWSLALALVGPVTSTP